MIGDKPFEETAFDDEEELRIAAVKNKKNIFGDDVVYIDYKRKVGAKGSRISGIPDGFLIDFSNPENPQLFYVEYELESHDLYEHIGPQIMKFYGSFESGAKELRDKLIKVIKENSNLKKEIETRLENALFDNVDALLNHLMDGNLGIIVVIDEQTEDLNSLLKKLAQKPDVVVFNKYQHNNKVIYQYIPFKEGITESKVKKERKKTKFKEIDTIVCPAREEGFKHAFINKNAWWAVRISPTLISQLKYIAMYETHPVSEIKWGAKIKRVEPYKDTGKYIIYVEDKKRIHPIKLDKGGRRGIAPQAPRYTIYKKLVSAKKMSDLW